MFAKDVAPLLVDIKCYFFSGAREKLYEFGVDSPVMHRGYALGWRRLKACNLRIDTNWEIYREGEFYVAVFDLGVVDAPPMFIQRKEVPSLKQYIELSRPKTVFTL